MKLHPRFVMIIGPAVMDNQRIAHTIDPRAKAVPGILRASEHLFTKISIQEIFVFHDRKDEFRHI